MSRCAWPLAPGILLHLVLLVKGCRTALISSVYQRMLLLDPSSRSFASKGEIVNLVSVDAMKLVEVIFVFILDLTLYLYM